MCSWKSLLLVTYHVTCSSWAFVGILQALHHHLSTTVTGVCTEIPCSSILHFLETRNLSFIAVQQTVCCITWDLGVGNFRADCKSCFRWGTHLYMSLFLSIHLSVRPFVCLLSATHNF